MVTVQMTVEEYLEMKSRQEMKGVMTKQKNHSLWTRRNKDPLRLQHDHGVENQEQRMDPSGNQSGRSQDRGRCRPGIGTGEREHAACNLQEIGQWQESGQSSRSLGR